MAYKTTEILHKIVESGKSKIKEDLLFLEGLLSNSEKLLLVSSLGGSGKGCF
jgi:hypothetical protein